MMVDSWNCNGGRFNIQACTEQFFDCVEDGDGELSGSLRSASAVWLDSGDKGNALAGSLEFTVDTKVIAPKRAGTDDRYAQLALACDVAMPLCLRRL